MQPYKVGTRELLRCKIAVSSESPRQGEKRITYSFRNRIVNRRFICCKTSNESRESCSETNTKWLFISIEVLLYGSSLPRCLHRIKHQSNNHGKKQPEPLATKQFKSTDARNEMNKQQQESKCHAWAAHNRKIRTQHCGGIEITRR